MGYKARPGMCCICTRNHVQADVMYGLAVMTRKMLSVDGKVAYGGSWCV